MAAKVWKGIQPEVFWRSDTFLLNKFFDVSTPSMRKGCGGEKKIEKIRTSIVATNVVASRPPERRPTGTPHARADFL